MSSYVPLVYQRHSLLNFQIAALAVITYDHVLTFFDEFERIWRHKITGASILFLLNRYVTPLHYVAIIFAVQYSKWTAKSCARYVKFEGAITVALIAICELIMILRVYALYGRSTLVIVFLLCLWVIQVAISGAAIHTVLAVPLPPGVDGCILMGTSSLFSALWITPLVTDSCIFILTLWKARQLLLRKSPTLHIFIRDGAGYFFFIFGVNLLNTLIYFLAPTHLRSVGASFSQLITSVMTSRLVLNLRSLSESASTRGIQTRIWPEIYSPDTYPPRHEDN